jgi:hypothetical protein
VPANSGVSTVIRGGNGTCVPNAARAIANFGDLANVPGITSQSITTRVTVGTVSFSAANADVFRTINTTFYRITFIQEGPGGAAATISNSNVVAGSPSDLKSQAGTITLADDLLVSSTVGFTNPTGII